MVDSAEELRDLLERTRPIARSDGYPAEVRQRVVAHALERRARGEPWRVIADRLGLSRTTVASWVVSGDMGRDEVVPVVTVADPAAAEPAVVATVAPTHAEPCGPVLVSPRGWRLEGLTLSAAIEVLERLG
jgi:transposase-like protein